jgi:hypothetical protein
MYHSTGFARDEILDLVELIYRFSKSEQESIGHPPSLGLFDSACVVLIYLRRNRRQVELAEQYECSQSTISRAITAVTPWIDRALRAWVPAVEDLAPGEQYLADGTLLPCWSWRDRPELYSGKHKTTGVNVQVVCDLYGQLRWVSDPVDGCRHDSAALDISGALTDVDPADWIGDKGYIGKQMITPIRKPAFRKLEEWEKEFNTGVNKIRWMIEQTISNLKTWRILHIDYRRPFETFETTISAVLALEFYRQAA